MKVRYDLRAILFNGTPQRFISGIVIENDNFVGGIIQRGQLLQGAQDDVRGLVVGGDMDRDKRNVTISLGRGWHALTAP